MNGVLEPIVNAPAQSISPPLVITVSGDSGCGKTSLIRAAGARLHNRSAIAAVIVTPAAERASDRLSDYIEARHVLPNVHLDLPRLRDIARTTQAPLLLVETVEPLNIPEHTLDPYKRVSVFSTSAGNDKVFEYPEALAQADLVVLTKTDLLPHVVFDVAKFTAAVHEINPQAPIIVVSIVQGSGMDAWENWLRAQLEQACTKSRTAEHPRGDWFVG